MGNENKKAYLSQMVKKNLEWIKDIHDRDIRFMLDALDQSISLTYTYFVYHDYTVKELAKLNNTSNKQIITWILIVAYIVGGGKYDFGTGNGLYKKEWNMLMRKYPKAKQTLPCCKCIWADTRTGRVICFRNCRGYNNYKSKQEEQ